MCRVVSYGRVAYFAKLLRTRLADILRLFAKSRRSLRRYFVKQLRAIQVGEGKNTAECNFARWYQNKELPSAVYALVRFLYKTSRFCINPGPFFFLISVQKAFGLKPPSHTALL